MTASPTSAAAEPFGARLGRHLGVLGRLAWPVVLSRAGILFLALADLAVLGRHSIDALNYMSMGISIFIPAMVGGAGFLLGVVAVVARRHGAGEFDEAVATWRRGLAWGLVVGLGASGLIWFSETWLTLFGQTPDLVEGGGAVGRALAPGALAQVMFLVCAFYLEGSGRPLPSLVAMAVANVVNIALNALTVDGFGAVGVAAATSAARFAMFFALLAWILADARVRAALRRLPSASFWGPGGWAAGAEFRAIGFAGGATNFFETAAFTALSQFAGHIGPAVLAAYTIGSSVMATAFMAALGLAVATGVRVGSERGAGRPGEAAFAGWTGLGATMTLMLCIGILAYAFSGPVTAFYTTDAAVAARAAPLLAIVAIALVFDGGQVVLGQCVRALGDTWVSAILICSGFAFVMVPAAWLLANPGGLAARGLFFGTAIGCMVVVLLLSLRFQVLARRAEAA
jgi:MATE family multidrug resistance protein